MKVIYYIIFHLILFILTDVFFYCIGKVLFYLGMKKLGFRLIAMSLAGDFNALKKERVWMVKNCPFHDCSKCKLWTCEYYDKGLSKK